MSFEKQLVRLQEIDSHLIRLQNDAKSWTKPEQLLKAKDDLAKLHTQMLQIHGLKKDIELDHASFQNLIQDALQERERVNAIMQESSDFRRMASFEKQLADIEKRIEKNTFKAQETKKKLEKIAKAQKNGFAKQQSLETSITSLETEQKDALETIAKEVHQLRSQRESLLAELTDVVKSDFEAAQKRFQGHGVEVLVGTKPSFCRVQLQPSQLADLNTSAEEILHCPYCARIIVKEEALG